ncbi:4-(cytidine 5'-diphospho)-2-C-methyl-D-erythritol kinase [Silvibacterium acidisoli]|uniref:4-(cytidine 5'-diphospho)-2-C-methyl-D-erythritol kinase n=1 Tax=Acidobacteriaceae bacterium ZG23-2 TaxID=2883246 RepID=UPI00406D0999
MTTTVRSYSKINLGLAIGPTRPDGFHALSTLYQTLDAHDLVSVEVSAAAATSITLTTNNERVPTDARNTAFKAVDLALSALHFAAKVHIHIEKRLPIQGGMGAGSANAAAALIALERELETLGAPLLPAGERLKIAAEVGSDVPLFLIGGSVLGVNRGEAVYPMPDLPQTWCIVALPEIGVSTPQAFRDWDALHASSALTAQEASDRLDRLSRIFASALCEPHSSGVSRNAGGLAGNPLLALVRTGIENDFEEVVFPQSPLLGEIKRILTGSDLAPEQSAVYAALSGSGSALFGLYPNLEAAELAEQRLAKAGIRSLRTKTLLRQEYWASLIESAS